MATRKQKRKQRKKQKARQPGASDNFADQPLEKQIDELKTSLKNLRIRRALAIAKSLVKHANISEDTLPLVVKAYELRLFEMVKNGHNSEAIQFFSTLHKDHPQWLNLLSSDIIVCLECIGAKPRILLSYEDDEESKKKVNSYIRRFLVDPSILANHPSLPESHILRREANTIMDIWEKIEHAQDKDIHTDLRTISRQSPFNYWRVFLHALNNFYNYEDSKAMTVIGRIPEGAALNSLVPVFRDLIARKPPEKNGTKPLFESIYANDPIYLLDQFDRNRCSNNSKPEDKICSLYEKLKLSQPRPLVLDCIVSALIQMNEDEYSRPEAFTKKISHKDGQEILLRANCHLGIDRVGDWDHYLKLNRSHLSKIELSLVYHHQGQRSTADCLDDYSDYSGPSKKVFKEQQKDVDHYYKLSIQTYPSEKCYEDWLKQYTLLGWDPNSIYKQWHHDFPENEDVLFCLLKQARKKRAIKQVDAYFEKLKNLLHNSPRILEISPFIQLERCIHRRKSFPTVKHLEKMLADLPTSQKIVVVCRETLYWLADGCPVDVQNSFVARLESFQSPYLMLVCLQKIEPSRPAYRRLPACIKKQFNNADSVVRGLYEVYQTNFNQWFISPIPQETQVQRALMKRSLDPKLLSDFLALLRRNCPSLNEDKITELVLRLTANGLNRKDISTPDMLCYRAIIYYFFGTEDDDIYDESVDKTLELLGTAKYLLEREMGDTRFFEEITHFVPEYRAEMGSISCSKRSISRLLKSEGSITTLADFRKRMATTSGFFPRSIARLIKGMPKDDFETIFDEFLDEMGGTHDLDNDDPEKWNPLQPFGPSKPANDLPSPKGKKAPTKKEPVEKIDNHPEFPNLFD